MFVAWVLYVTLALPGFRTTKQLQSPEVGDRPGPGRGPGPAAARCARALRPEEWPQGDRAVVSEKRATSAGSPLSVGG